METRIEGTLCFNLNKKRSVSFKATLGTGFNDILYRSYRDHFEENFPNDCVIESVHFEPTESELKEKREKFGLKKEMPVCLNCWGYALWEARNIKTNKFGLKCPNEDCWEEGEEDEWVVE